MRVWIGHTVAAVDNIVIRIPLVIGKTRHGNPEIGVALIVVAFHLVALIVGIVIPRRHKHYRALARSGKTECDSTVGILHRSHLRHAAGIRLLLRLARIGHIDGLDACLAARHSRGRNFAIARSRKGIVGRQSRDSFG